MKPISRWSKLTSSETICDVYGNDWPFSVSDIQILNSMLQMSNSMVQILNSIVQILNSILRILNSMDRILLLIVRISNSMVEMLNSMVRKLDSMVDILNSMLEKSNSMIQTQPTDLRSNAELTRRGGWRTFRQSKPRQTRLSRSLSNAELGAWCANQVG